MNVIILNPQLDAIGILDTFNSLIWTVRYYSYGDFEIRTQVNKELLALLQFDYYLWIKESDRFMIIEDIQIDSDVEDCLVISGRSLESILERRIIWEQTMLSGDLQSGIQKLLNENIINPTMTDRKISNFSFSASSDPAITELTLEAQFMGDNLYESIEKICETNNIGFKVTVSDKTFIFSLYAGSDRSWSQTTNPYVIFSPAFDNFINSSYMKSKKALKTVTLVGGEGEGSDKKTAIASADYGGSSGVDRREIFTDASSVSSKTNDGELTDNEYVELLIQKGKEKLANYIIVDSFEGEAEAERMFVYGKDFFIGDVVQIANDYGIESKSRIIELVISQDENGTRKYPTFSAFYN